MNRRLVIALTLLIFCPGLFADDFTGLVKEGNKAFKEGDYNSALGLYREAEAEKPELPEIHYNIGSALYKEGKYEEAADRFQKAFTTEEVKNEAQARYNLGNVYYRSGDYQKAIEAYQKSLELVPEDMDAKYNLELARKMLKEQLKPQEQQQNQQDQQQQQQQEQQQQEQEPQPQEPREKENQDQQQQQQVKPRDENEMTKEDAERILNALRDDEKEIQKDLRKLQGPSDYQGNDW